MTKSVMLAGTVGHVKGVPHPLTGAGFSDNSDTEVRELLSGARTSWRAPVTYQTLTLSWKGTRESLSHMRDLYNRRWGGPGHFWIVSPDVEEDGNLLPMRWSVGHQLAYVLNGLGRVKILESTAVIRGGSDWSGALSSKTLPYCQILVEPGTPYYFGMLGTSAGLTSTQGVVVQGHLKGASETQWETLGTFRSSTGTNATPVLTKAQSLNYDFLRIGINIGMSTSTSISISALELSHVDYGTTPDKEIRCGTGLGAVQFTSNLESSIVSNRIDRKSISAELVEVEL